MSTIGTKEYRRIAFLSGPRHPGGMPAAFDTSKGGKILRTTTEFTDDVVITSQAGMTWEAPWSSVFWAIPGAAGVPVAKVRTPLPSRIAQTRAPATQAARAEAQKDIDDDEPPPSEPKTETRAKPSGDWKPPKKPKARKAPPPKPAPTDDGDVEPEDDAS